jgi:hypothetical protein
MDHVELGDSTVAAAGVSASLLGCGTRGINSRPRLLDRPNIDLRILDQQAFLGPEQTVSFVRR